MVEILTVLFVFELTLFMIIDYHKYSFSYTPTLFIGVPFAVVLVIAVFVSTRFNFLPVNEIAVFIWCLGLFLFWVSGSLLTFAVVKTKITSPFVDIASRKYISVSIRGISWLCIMVLSISLLRSFTLHGTITGEAFSRDFASHGIAAHCLNIMKFNAAYIIAARDGKKIQAGFIFLLTFIFLFLYNVKGAILLTGLVCLFASFIMSNSKLNLKKILIVILLGCVLFVLSYVISLGSFSINFITTHFLSYVVAGIVGFSEHIRQNLPVDIDFYLIFQPIRNLYNAFTGGEIFGRVSDIWVVTNVIYAKNSNVKTFFGDIYIYSGLIKGALVTAVFGITSYFFLIITILKKELLFLILYLLMISSLSFGWFNFYFNDLFYYEIILYVFFVTVLSKFLAVTVRPGLFCKSEQCEYLENDANCS